MDIGPTAEWIIDHAGRSGTLVFVDAPLIIDNPTGQRLCEKQVGQRYGRWQVSANTTNLGSKPKGGTSLLTTLEERGWRYDSGLGGPPSDGTRVSECYPYTALVGHEALYAVEPPPGAAGPERPRYKRKPRHLRVAQWRPVRAGNCDELLDRLFSLSNGQPPLDLASHPVTAALREPSPPEDRAYKHREDLIDAAIAAWTALVWLEDPSSCQVLGPGASDGREPTIIAPAVASQRRDLQLWST